jgi:hypothetical protein
VRGGWYASVTGGGRVFYVCMCLCECVCASVYKFVYV